MDKRSLKASKSTPFFRNTRVSSCQYVQTNKGVPVAIAFPQVKTGYKAENSWVNQRRSTEVMSHNSRTYKPIPSMHSGMEKKPLMPYHPFAYRSRLPTSYFVIPYQNSSQVEIGDRTFGLKDHFRTTYSSYMSAPDLHDCTSNQGIVARKMQWHRDHTAN